MTTLQAIAGFLLAFVVGVLGNLVAAEIFEWCPKWTDLIVRRAVRRLPFDLHARVEEEWRAEIEQLPRGLARMAYAVGLLRAARRIARENDPAVGERSRVATRERRPPLRWVHTLAAVGVAFTVLVESVNRDSPKAPIETGFPDAATLFGDLRITAQSLPAHEFNLDAAESLPPAVRNMLMYEIKMQKSKGLDVEIPASLLRRMIEDTIQRIARIA